MHNIDLEKACEAKKKLIDWVCCATEDKEDLFCNIETFGQLVDAAKDMAELEEKCVKAEYYKTVTKAMKEYDEDDEGSERYGYDHWRYADGQFAPKGHGHRSGYTMPMRGNVHWHDPNVDGMVRMGYPMEYNGEHKSHDERDWDRSGYPSRHGSNYDAYVNAKRHYTESHKDEDHKMMNDRIETAVMDMVQAGKDMWRDASPETRKGMKATFMKMLEEMV